MRARENFPSRQFFDIRYEEILSDPFEAIERIYDHFGIEFSGEAEKRMRARFAKKEQNRHGAHIYSFEDLGLDLTTERARFAAYQERFNVLSEVK